MSMSFARLAAGAAMILLIGCVTLPLRAQERDTVAEKQRLSHALAELGRSLDDIRFSSVDVVRVDEDLGRRLLEPLMAAVRKDSIELESMLGEPATSEWWPSNNYLFESVLRIVRSPDAAPDLSKFKEALAQVLGITPDDIEDQEAEPVLWLARRLVNELNCNPTVYYLICTRDRTNPGLVALLGGDERDGEFYLKGQPLAGIDLYDYLQSIDPTLYADLKAAVASRPQH